MSPEERARLMESHIRDMATLDAIKAELARIRREHPGVWEEYVKREATPAFSLGHSTQMLARRKTTDTLLHITLNPHKVELADPQVHHLSNGETLAFAFTDARTARNEARRLADDLVRWADRVGGP